ncbi:hypothetical protein D3C76_1081470 [compost metagenome]
MLEVVGYGDAAADAMFRIHGKAHICAAVHHSQPGVVGAHDLFVIQAEAGTGLYIPGDAVVAVGQAQIGGAAGQQCFIDGVAVIVAEHHHVFALEFGYAGIKNQGRGVGHIRRSKDRIGRVADNHIAGFQFADQGQRHRMGILLEG